MKRILIVLTVTLFMGLFMQPASASRWVYIGGTKNEIKKLPNKWTFSNGTKTGNFKQMSMAKKLAEGWRPITVINNSTFDADLQKRVLKDVDIVIFSNHAEITYTITQKVTLNQYKKKKGREIILEGVAVLNEKYVNDWETGYDADKTILKDYFNNTIKPLIQAGTLQSIRDLNNGDEYSWPTL